MRFTLKTVLGAGAIGAAAVWLFDPDQGTRRHPLQDRARSRAIRAQLEAEDELRHERGWVEGTIHRINRAPRRPPADDRTLVDRIKSGMLGRGRFADHDVLVEAYDGVVTLRGQVDDPITRLELESALERMPGVRRVESLLHAAGEDAPNKAEALHASD